MKYPSLSSMPVDSLILMARQKDNEEFTLYVKQIILDYYLSNILFVELLNLYRSAKGLKRKILANAIAIAPEPVPISQTFTFWPLKYLS